MRKFLLLLLFPIILFAQNEEKEMFRIVTIVENNDLLYDGISDGKNCHLKNVQFPKYREDTKMLFYINNIIGCENGKFISGYYLGKQYFMEYKNDRVIFKNTEIINIDNAIDSIKNLSSEEYVDFVNKTKFSSEAYAEVLLDRIEDKIKSYKKYGIGVIYAYPDIEYGIANAKFKIFNASKKTIKYITFNFYGSNAVKDKVLYRNGTYNTYRKGIGPVESYSIASWNFDTVWLTDTVDELNLTSIIIQYMDGTTKTIKMNNNIWMEDNLFDNFNALYEIVEKFYK
ncbi:MAG: hypothetical protein ACTTJM_00745 [Bergeyella cardium]